MRATKILIVNPFGIGDVIFSTPLIEAVKKSFPGSFLGYVCNKRACEVIRSNPHVNRIFIYEKDDFRTHFGVSKIEGVRKLWQFLGTIRAERFDVGIDLSLNYQASLFLKLIGVRERCGFNFRKRGKFLTRRIDIDGFSEKHVIEYYLDMLTLLGIDPTAHRQAPRVYLSAGDRLWADQFLAANDVPNGERLIGVIPGCGASWGIDACRRRWDVEGFAGVADRLASRFGARIVLLGDKKEAVLCERVALLMKHMPVIACGKTTVADFLGLVSRCDLVITNDGGPLHMAVAAGVNTVSIFGPVDERIYGPYPQSARHIVISRKDLDCRPCYRKFKYSSCDERPCLRTIAADDVFAAAERLFVKYAGKRDESTAGICRDR